ncbi:MAG TPA: TIGR03016 family PEP-CTERM system-associated outer membrane protein [Alphaproteobacteria bacterium]|nr:TIGR03016 family PEP-CTERM system-associated outer membrane protein [Alphaproteobacteria bacterium]
MLVFALGGLGADAASAEQWRVTPRLTVEQAYNSNVELAPKGQEKSDFITSISPGAAVRGTGRRLSLNFDYDPEQVFFAHRSDRNELRQRFRGLTNAELIEQLLFFEASGSVNQQFTNNTGAIGGTTLTASNDLRTVQTYSAGPVLRNHLGSFADTETRYTYSLFKVDSANFSDTEQNELSFIARSGRDFTTLAWTFTLSGSESERQGGNGATSFSGTKTEQRLAKLDTQYAFNSHFSLLAGAGWEEFEDPTLTDPPDDPVWDVGFQIRPNSVSTLRFTAGQRFGGANYNASVDYLFNPNTRLRGAYIQQINTSQGLAIQNLRNLGVNQGGQLIDTQTGRPFLPGDPQFGLNNAAFKQDRFTLGFEHSTLRNTYSIDIYDEVREFDTQAQSNTHSRGINLGFSRSLTPLLSLNLGASYAMSTFENQGDRQDDYYSATSGLSYRLSDTAQARLNYRHTARKSDAANADIIEDFVAVSLVKEF